MQKKELSQKNVYISLGVVLIAVAFISGVYLGYENRPSALKVMGVFGKEEGAPASVNFEPFWKTWATLEKKYVSDNGVVDDQDKIWGAIRGLVAAYGDPYTVFMPPTEAKMFEEDISGNFSGVGMEIGMKEGILTVIAPLKNTPAERAGIRAGDLILKIDDTITNNMTVDEAVRMIRGEKGTRVRLTIVRRGDEEPKEISIIRDTINLPTIDTELRPDGIFVIKLYNFSAISTALFREALREFTTTGSNRLILDLRGNPGGYLDASIEMASFFLPAGKVVVREDFGGNREEGIYRSKGYNIFNKNLRMVILVNEGSASASEILAGALQEHGVAKLVGEQTFGKGSVQELVKITSDTFLKVTIARWLTPNGVNISKEGLTPDYIVEFDPDADEDPQLQKALELLR
jgi:carboxyl-terminal processing protease